MRATVAEFPYDEGIWECRWRADLSRSAIPPWVVSPQAVITADNVKDFPIRLNSKSKAVMPDSGRKTEMSGVESKTLLQARGIAKAFAGVQALKGVDFDVRAGKSTP